MVIAPPVVRIFDEDSQFPQSCGAPAVHSPAAVVWPIDGNEGRVAGQGCNGGGGGCQADGPQSVAEATSVAIFLQRRKGSTTKDDQDIQAEATQAMLAEAIAPDEIVGPSAAPTPTRRQSRSSSSSSGSYYSTSDPHSEHTRFRSVRSALRGRRGRRRCTPSQGPLRGFLPPQRAHRLRQRRTRR